MTAPCRVAERNSAAAGLATITMNRPERRNVLSEAHMRELIAAFSAAGEQPDTRAVILAANGPIFSAGHDFADMVERDLDGMRRRLTTCTELMLTLRRLPQPVVAKVQGLATAAGCQLVASCDLAVAVEEASFATPGGKRRLVLSAKCGPSRRRGRWRRR
jgi:enoyl-CoA hydratase/carnithine racemase